MATVSADLEDGHVIPEHSHPEDQLLFASEGVMTLSTKQGVWVVPPMRAVWIPAETFHSVATSGRVSMRTLYLQPKLGRSLPQKCIVINVTSLLRELVLHACRIGRLHRRAVAERRQRLFREETKMTFSRWRQQLRLLHAMQRLASGEKVTAAALDAGYNSTSAFIAMFRKQLGKTPARYLESRAE
jgi:AraC-like DNA-binding protein